MKCQICSAIVDYDNYTEEFSIPMKEKQYCFTCEFWDKIKREDMKRPPHTWCVIDGTHYVIEPDEPGNYFQGFGGAEFQIEFNDGFKVVTHNLWCQGDISPEWREKFPDNARFENNLKWKQIGTTYYLIEEKNETI